MFIIYKISVLIRNTKIIDKLANPLEKANQISVTELETGFLMDINKKIYQ